MYQMTSSYILKKKRLGIKFVDHDASQAFSGPHKAPARPGHGDLPPLQVAEAWLRQRIFLCCTHTIVG
jgi:hypothetical protein